MENQNHYDEMILLMADLYICGLENILENEQEPLVLDNISHEAYMFIHHVHAASRMCSELLQPLLQRAQDIQDTADLRCMPPAEPPT